MKTKKIIKEHHDLFDFENCTYQVRSTFLAKKNKTVYYITGKYKGSTNLVCLINRYLTTDSLFDMCYNLIAGPYCVFSTELCIRSNDSIIYWDDMETPIDMLMKLKHYSESDDVVFDTDNII